MERTSAPYRAGFAHLGDVTRDGAHPPKIAQFRIEMRAAIELARRAIAQPACGALRGDALPAWFASGCAYGKSCCFPCVIQWGMMPLLAQDFHRVSLAGPLSNIPAVTADRPDRAARLSDARRHIRVGRGLRWCSRKRSGFCAG